jgi:hypothetical protein
LGSNATVIVNDGTLLVRADDAINGKNIQLSTDNLGLKFEGNYSGAVGSLTLSANSSIDLGEGSVSILFQGLVLDSHFLKIYNWTGTTQWDGGNDTDKVFLLPAITPEELNQISFYSDDYGTDSFLGTGFDLGLQPTGFAAPWNEGNQIIPAPEPETYATALLLLLGGAWWMMKKKKRRVT